MAYMSEDGYKKLMAELKHLETVERPKISAAIAEARDNVLLICKKDEEHTIRKYVNDAQIKLGEEYI